MSAKWTKVKAKFRGVSDLLMHRRTEEMETKLRSGVKSPTKFISDVKEETLRVLAVPHLYTDGEGGIVLNAGMLWAALMGAGSDVVYKTVGRASYKITTDEVCRLPQLVRFERGVLSVSLSVNGRQLRADNLEDWQPHHEWTRNPTTGTPMPVTRPIISNWEFEFVFSYNSNEISEEIVKQLWEKAGLGQGVGSKRAGKGFPYGQFEMVNWEVLDNN